MELVAWVNDLLQISYTKIEQCGAGGAYCQIIDSIYCKYLVTLAIVLPYFVSPCTLPLVPSSTLEAPRLPQYYIPPTLVQMTRENLILTMDTFSGRTDATRKDECEARIRVHRQLQDPPNVLQAEEDRQGVYSSMLFIFISSRSFTRYVRSLLSFSLRVLDSRPCSFSMARSCTVTSSICSYFC
jgi:hypothetical protein